MPRKDPTFTDQDLIRLFCKNLDPSEKKRVLEKFMKYVIDREPICDTDINVTTNYCKWAWTFLELTEHADAISLVSNRILATLTFIESLLLALSAAGPFGRLIVLLRLLIGWIIAFAVVLLTIIKLFAELQPWAVTSTTFFCKHLHTEIGENTPNLNGLPKSYDESVAELLGEIERIANEIKKGISDLVQWFSDLPNNVLDEVKSWFENFDISWNNLEWPPVNIP